MLNIEGPPVRDVYQINLADVQRLRFEKADVGVRMVIEFQTGRTVHVVWDEFSPVEFEMRHPEGT